MDDTEEFSPYRFQNGGYIFCGACEARIGEYVFMARPYIGRSIGTCSEKCRRRAAKHGHSYSV